MRIWWCQEHEASSDGPDTWNCLRDGYGPCRMVPMRLIPDNDEAIRRATVAVMRGLEHRQRLADETRSTFWLDPQFVVEEVIAALEGETP